MPLIVGAGTATLALSLTSADAQSYSSSNTVGWASTDAASDRLSQVYNGQLIGSDTSGNLATLQSTGLSVIFGANTSVRSSLTSSALSLTDGSNTTNINASSVTTGTLFASNFNVTNFNPTNINASGNGAFGGSLSVTGNQTIGGALAVGGSGAPGSKLTVTGGATVELACRRLHIEIPGGRIISEWRQRNRRQFEHRQHNGHRRVDSHKRC